MKCENSDDVTPPIIRKSKGTTVFTRAPDGTVIGRAWPKPRGNRGTPVQAAWVQDFVDAAAIIKNVDPCTFQTATLYAQAPCSGYTFYRDYLMTARAGKLSYYMGGDYIQPQLPQYSRGGDKGPPRIITPTASVSRTTGESLTNSILKTLTPNTYTWNNNAFWSPISEPEKLIVKAQGLYWINAFVEFTGSTTGSRQARIATNTQNPAFIVHQPVGTDGACFLSVSGLWYFSPGDWAIVQAYANATGVTAKLSQFQMIAMTPEQLI